MTTLHMDTDAGREIANQINQACDEFHAQLVELNNRIQSYVGSSWVSPTATKFSGEFTQWAQQQRLMIEALQTLAQKLEFEAAEWEQAAQGF